MLRTFSVKIKQPFLTYYFLVKTLILEFLDGAPLIKAEQYFKKRQYVWRDDMPKERNQLWRLLYYVHIGFQIAVQVEPYPMN